MSSVYFLINRILGKYKILEHIGHGGMSEVYKGQQLQLHRPVAIKVLHPFLADDEGFVARFQREARIIATLRHPNIVQVFDFDYNAELDIYYMVMEYIGGPTLKMRMEQTSLTLEFCTRTGAAIADALDYAHERGMIHRDIKPANIMFLDDNQPVLTDFGIARMLTLSGLTASGAMVGTPAYMAPEVGLGKSGTASSDIYALGVVLYHAITGSLPFNSESPMGIVMQHINEPPPQPSLLLPTLPSALEDVILKALEKDPLARFSRASEMGAALRQSMNLDGSNNVMISTARYVTPTKLLVAPDPEISEPLQAPGQISSIPPADLGNTGDEIAGGYPLSHKPQFVFKKLLQACLIFLAMGIISGGAWMIQSGRLPPAFQAWFPYRVKPTPDLIPDNPTSTEIPTATPTPPSTPSLPDLTTVTRFPTPEVVSNAVSCVPRGRVERVIISPDEIVGPVSSVVAYIAIRNTGNCAWMKGTQVQFFSGRKMDAPAALDLPALASGSTVQFHLPLTAPQELGSYNATWHVVQPDGRLLSNAINIQITVQDIATATPIPFPTIAEVLATPAPLSRLTPELIEWHNGPDVMSWQGTVQLQAAGGTGEYRYFHQAIREVNLITEGRFSFTAPRCDGITLDYWVMSGIEVYHWQDEIAYPDPGQCN
ncbi:MAG: protein kinase [Anaerolineae bacterium]|nr:protein kinase [Anaerolineae bacterium]